MTGVHLFDVSQRVLCVYTVGRVSCCPCSIDKHVEFSITGHGKVVNVVC